MNNAATILVCSIKDQGITFRIYAAGADFQTPHQHRVFERPDYESLVELGITFIEALVKAAK